MVEAKKQKLPGKNCLQLKEFSATKNILKFETLLPVAVHGSID